MPTDDQTALASLTASGIRIPPQPKVLLELREKLAQDDYSVKAICQIISQDPGLVAMLFKASRSPIFSRGRKFEKLEQVLQVVGIKQTYSLVQAMSLSAAIGNNARTAFERFWARSGDVAQLAAMVAEDHVMVCNVFPDQAYMAGIFHQCGVPVLMMRFPDYCKKLNSADPGTWPNLDEEDKKFNVDHCTIGYLVARHWGLPDFVCAAIRYHHDIPTEEAGNAISLVSILQLAVHAYLSMSIQPNPVWDQIGGRVLEEVGVSPLDLPDYLDELTQRFNEKPP